MIILKLFLLTYNKMERLPKDVLIKTALESSPPDLINFCVAEKEKYGSICDSKEFWVLKLQKDYPKLYEKLEKPIKDPKNEYMKEFTHVSRKLEELANYISEELFERIFVKDFIKFINKEKYERNVYNKLYEYYNNIDFKIFSGKHDEHMKNYLKEISGKILNDINPVVSTLPYSRNLVFIYGIGNIFYGLIKRKIFQ
jgi:hypothetical protein